MTFLLTALAVLALLGVRNHIAFRVSTRRIEEIHAHHVALIEAGQYQPLDDGLYESIPSYSAVMLDLTKWTYRQFFPKQIGEPQ